MKTYEEYKSLENFINLGQLNVYKDFIESSNQEKNYKMWDGTIFMTLAHVDVDQLLRDNFEDYKTYFDIITLDRAIVKEDNKHLFNVYQLKHKE